MSVAIVDSHQHLWNLNKIPLPWVDSIDSLNRNFLLSDYQRMNSPNQDSDFEYEIVSSLYMEVDVAEADLFREIQLVVEKCHDPSTMIEGVIPSTRPGSSLFQQTLELAQTHAEIKGFRRVLHVDETPAGYCLQSRFLEDIQLLGDHSLTFDVCIRRQELADVCELARACPETQFVLDHCGNADVRIPEADFEKWSEDMRRIAGCRNVACKVSGFVWTIQNEDWTYEREIEPILRVVFEAFGEDRILFGGDWPVCTLSILSFQQWLNALHRYSTTLGDAVTRKLFSENAKKIYRV